MIFGVTVQAPQPVNNNPVIDPIEAQSMTVGETRDLSYNATDPDGDPLSNPTAYSDNDGVASAFSPGLGTVSLSANGEGTATITVYVEDGRGGSATTTFAITVQAQPVNTGGGSQVNLDDLPNISPIEDQILQTAQSIYANGLAMQPPVNPGLFSVVGDTPPGVFLGDFGDGSGDFGGLDDAVDLSNLVFYYTSLSVPVGGNSFQGGGALASNPNWRAQDLLDPAQADPSLCGGGETPLDCELRVTRPAVVFIIVGRNDVLSGTPLDVFNANLDAIVQHSLSWGVIPILATIPGSNDQFPALIDYNSAIATVAQNYHLPLLNVWRRINRSAPGGVDNSLQLTSSGVGDSLTENELNTYGVPNRNLIALRMLQQLLINVPIP